MWKALRHGLRLVAFSLRARGVLAMVKSAVRWIADRELRAVDSGFDARFGTDLNAALTPAEGATAAGGAPGRVRASRFVELGSGKGGAVLLAAMRDHRRVVGVELSPVLHAIATANL